MQQHALSLFVADLSLCEEAVGNALPLNDATVHTFQSPPNDGM